MVVVPLSFPTCLWIDLIFSFIRIQVWGVSWFDTNCFCELKYEIMLYDSIQVFIYHDIVWYNLNDAVIDRSALLVLQCLSTRNSTMDGQDAMME